jgi:dCTP deaminase
LLLNDNDIRAACEAGLLAPYAPAQVREVVANFSPNPPIQFRRTISAGVSSYGYDLRLAADGFRVFSPVGAQEIDPKAFDEGSLVEPPLRTAGDGAQYYLLPPHTYALGVTVERFAMPDDLIGICVGKSTYARAGVLINTTPIEPGWTGHLVVEIGNLADLPVRVYVGEGIAQCVFLRGERPSVTYGDRSGKYQGQSGLTTAKV